MTRDELIRLIATYLSTKFLVAYLKHEHKDKLSEFDVEMYAEKIVDMVDKAGWM